MKALIKYVHTATMDASKHIRNLMANFRRLELIGVGCLWMSEIGSSGKHGKAGELIEVDWCLSLLVGIGCSWLALVSAGWRSFVPVANIRRLELVRVCWCWLPLVGTVCCLISELGSNCQQ